ncbi:MAG: TolC family protein [Firmicutes bacterium]|nr:TolC family protein [Bacillota bacterium]
MRLCTVSRRMMVMFIGAVLLISTLAATVLAGSTLAATTKPDAASGAPEAKGSSGKLTLKEAVDFALQHSNAMKLASLALDTARLAYQQAKADQLIRASILADLQAEATWQAAQKNYEIAKSDLALQVEQAYYDVQKAKRGLVISQENVERANKQLEIIRSKFKLGMVARLDVITAESEVAGAQVDLSKAEANLALANMRFNQIIGRDLEVPVELASDFGYKPVTLDMKKETERALASRLEILKAQDAVELAKKEVEVNNNDFTPALDLARSKIGLSQAEVELEDTKVNVLLEIKQNYESMKDAERRIALQEKAFAQAQESLKIAKARYDAGVITSIDLFDAQRALYQADTARLQAVFDYNVALARLYKSLSLSLQERSNDGSR